MTYEQFCENIQWQQECRQNDFAMFSVQREQALVNGDDDDDFYNAWVGDQKLTADEQAENEDICNKFAA